jgi:hypothetical protein
MKRWAWLLPGRRASKAISRTSRELLGISGHISYADTPLCTNVGNSNDDVKGSLSWVGLQIAGTRYDIVQIGLSRCKDPFNPTGCTQALSWFWAWGRVNCPGQLDVIPAPRKFSAARTGTHTFEVHRTGTDYIFEFDGVAEEDVPRSAICWTPTSAAWLGEVWDNGDQMGLPFPSSQNYTAASYEASVGSPWTSPTFSSPCYRQGDQADYSCGVTSGTAFQIWTDR